MSYESPITIMHRQLANQINIQLEGEVLKAVMECNIDVNKDELIKALAYDRDQYAKGYEDGKAEAMQWIPCSERLPDEEMKCLVSLKGIGGVYIAQFEGDHWLSAGGWTHPMHYDAWMPLPEPYKEDE